MPGFPPFYKGIFLPVFIKSTQLSTESSNEGTQIDEFWPSPRLQWKKKKTMKKRPKKRQWKKKNDKKAMTKKQWQKSNDKKQWKSNEKAMKKQWKSNEQPWKRMLCTHNKKKQRASTKNETLCENYRKYHFCLGQSGAFNSKLHFNPNWSDVRFRRVFQKRYKPHDSENIEKMNHALERT